MQSTSESLLIRLNSVDNTDAWARFVQLYTPLIFFWARMNGLSQHDSADLVQDVLVIVYQKLPTWKYDSQKSFRGWLRTITLNRHRQLARKKKIKIVDSNRQQIDGLVDQKLAESTWDQGYAEQLVATAMDLIRSDFAPKTWSALQILVSSGRSAADISRETGVSVWTIYSAKNRLMSRLRSELDGMLE